MSEQEFTVERRKSQWVVVDSNELDWANCSSPAEAQQIADQLQAWQEQDDIENMEKWLLSRQKKERFE